MEIVLVGCSPICYIPLATLVIVPPESESITCGTYILNTKKFTQKKVNQAFSITVKRVVYFINFLGLKTLKSVSLFYVALSFTSALFTTKCTFFPNKWVHFSFDQGISKRSSCENSFNFLFSMEKCKIFSCDGTKVVKTRMICRNTGYTYFFSIRSCK